LSQAQPYTAFAQQPANPQACEVTATIDNTHPKQILIANAIRAMKSNPKNRNQYKQN